MHFSYLLITRWFIIVSLVDKTEMRENLVALRPVSRNVVWGGVTRMETPKASTRVGSGEGVSTSPVGVGCPPQKIFGLFSFEMVHFDTFWSTF